MTGFRSISPHQAFEFVDRAGVSDPRRVIIDFAAAGIVKGYALVIESLLPPNAPVSARGATISQELWKRIQRAGLSDEVWHGGAVRLEGDPASDLPDVCITGLSFSERSLKRVVDHHSGSAHSIAPAVAWAPDQVAPEVAPQLPDRHGALPSAIPTGALAVTVNQAMAALGLGRTKINALMNDGRLERKKVDGRTLITVESIRRLAGSGPASCVATDD